MFDYIFDNIFVLIPIAVVIGVRVVSVWQKRQAAAAKASPAQTGRWEDADEADASLEPPEAKPPAPKAPQAAAVVPAAAVHPATAKPAQRTAEAPATAAPVRSGRFPGNLEYLPPLKRALVLSEILGPPKGF
jgi:hypothetical protein